MGKAGRLEKHSPKRLSVKLRQIRTEFGDSQIEFLDRLGNPEAIMQGSISGYERGEREPPLLILLKYAEIANVSTDVLINDSLELPLKIGGRKKH